jgi:glycosyltransferase involved in cell wall biosynthesis
MSVKNILFAIFDLNDNNYMKMPWAFFVNILPIIAEKLPNARIYVLTDTKNCINVKKIIERENLKVLSLSRPVLRYPYRGLLSILKTLKKRLNIDTLVTICGWNIHGWSTIAGKLEVGNFAPIIFTPLYQANELLEISVETLASLLKYGGFTDFTYFIKLIFENFVVRLILNLTRPVRKPTIVVFTESEGKIFQQYGFKTYKVNIRLRFNIKQSYRSLDQCIDNPSIAYFGLPIVPRGYDIVVKLARNSSINFVMYLREHSPMPVRIRALLRDINNNLKVIFKFFRSSDELISEAKKHHLTFLPFRFVISDFPLVVLEALCSGRLVVTTQYSNVHVANAPNLIVLGLSQVKNPTIIERLAKKNIGIVMDSCEIDWEFVADELIKILELR